MELSIANVTRARNQIDDVEWSAEDGTRSEMDFLCRIVEAVIKAGATTVNIPDTVGYTVPEEYYALFKMVRERVPNSDKARFSAHCHDDLGMAVANSLAGVKIGGARQVECTINGLGERAGNASLEELVMAMKVRNDVLPYWTNVDGTLLTRASKLVAAATSFPVQYNKAIVGRNAFAHEAGIHQDGMLKDARTYEIMRPQDVGQTPEQLVLGRLDAILRPHGLTFARYEALVLLCFSSRGSLPLGKMGERLQVHPTSITSIVQRLEADGLVSRRPHPDDGRAVLAEVTEAGRALVERATRELVGADFALGALSDEQLAELSALLAPVRRGAGDFA